MRAGLVPLAFREAIWLQANRPTAFEPGIIHGDYHLANVLFRNDGPELAAIVDWELTTIGDPLLDLGWVLATWPESGDASRVRCRRAALAWISERRARNG
jgi:aminoglycoside phosphotransferase (APT) family kinase protein